MDEPEARVQFEIEAYIGAIGLVLMNLYGEDVCAVLEQGCVDICEVVVIIMDVAAIVQSLDVEAIAWTLLGRISLALNQEEIAERNFERGLALAQKYHLITVEASILDAQGDEAAACTLLAKHGAIFEDIA